LIPPLTDEENKRVSDTFSPGKSYIVSQYKNKTVGYNVIDRLGHGEWLNDELINFYTVEHRV
jgi:Ulp1 family protease